MIFLKNYTSDVPVAQTLHRIEQVLIRCGVSKIAKEYGNTAGKISAVTFSIAAAESEILIRLPVDEEQALTALWLNYANGDKLTPDGKSLVWASYKKKKREDFRQQAERTAWKIMQDWIEVQLSMIQMKQADALEVFLPYAWDGKRTFYQSIKDSKFAGLLPEKAGAA